MNLFLSKKNNGFFSETSLGFTIVELLIVITIIGVMAGVVWVNYSEFNKVFSLERSANQTAQEIRMVLEKAISVEIPEGAVGEDFKGGYGVFFEIDQDNFIVFIDTNNTGRFNSGDNPIIKEFFFESGVKIKNAQLLGDPNCNDQKNFRSVVFLPPDPTVFIGGKISEKSRCDSIEVILTHEYLDEDRKIKVNRAGLIELE